MKYFCLLMLSVLISCSNDSNNKEEDNSKSVVTDSLTNLSSNVKENGNDVFSGEYSIGDGGSLIVPFNKYFQMKNEKGDITDTLYAIAKEQSLFVYANKNKSKIFKMNSGHKSGMYYEPDEKWPVNFIKPLVKEETELEESERIFKQRHTEDSIAYSELSVYNGTYTIQTESDGVNAKLVLHYNNDKTFNYTWSFEVASEEVNCKANKKGILMMDRTQHGFDRIGECLIHFNFNGSWSEGMVVEIDFEDQKKCNFIKGNDCTYSGTYVNKQKK